MLLSRIKDSVFQPLERFSLTVKNHKVYFEIDGEKYQFGSKMYPISKRNPSLFLVDITEKGEYEEVAESIERGNWKHRNGYCYSNAEILQSAFLAHGIKARYFSGWVFVGANFPVHHAWVVVDDNVYDISINVTAQKLMAQQHQEGKDLYHKENVKAVKEVEANPYPLRENFVWGEVPNHMIYVGSEDTPNGSRLKYNKAMESVKNHPSYRSMAKQVGDQTNFKTRYQHLLDEV